MIAVLLAGCGGGNAPQPGAAATTSPAASTIAVANGDFEQRASDGSIPGWTLMRHAGQQVYEIAVEPSAAYRGSGGFRITRTREQIYGSLVQDVELPAGIAGMVELSAMMKSADVGPDGWKLMVIAADVPEYSAALVGSNDWQRVSVRAKLPANAHTIRVGATLLDSGTGWLDDVELRAVAP